MRNFNIIRGLAGRHQITLMSFVEQGVDFEVPEDNPLHAYCRRIITIPEPPQRSTLRRLWQMASGREPDLALRLRSSHFEVRLRRLLSENSFAVIQVEGIELAWTISVIRMLGLIRKLFLMHIMPRHNYSGAPEADLNNYKRWPAAAYSWLQSGRLRAYERWACSSADWVTAVSTKDKENCSAKCKISRANHRDPQQH